MTDKTREDVVEAVARAIATKTYAYCTVTEEGSDQYDCGEWEEFGSDAKATYIAAAEAALATLSTLPDVEADMRERCARVADDEAADIRQHAHLATDNWQQGRLAVAEVIATAIRSLPLSNKGESRG